MRRIVIAGTALVVLGVSATAAAASPYNNYSGSQLSISAGNKAPLSMVEKLQASAPSGSRAAPLTNIKLTIYGVKLDVGKLPIPGTYTVLVQLQGYASRTVEVPLDGDVTNLEVELTPDGS